MIRVFTQGEEGTWFLNDMGSANGTMINGKKLKKREMTAVGSGDTITFWRFVFEYQELNAFVQLLNGLS